MTTFVALLRAINVGGTGKLAMRELVSLCEEIGLRDPKTYIQSGNVAFNSALSEAKVRAKLATALAAKMGKPVGVFVRSGAELQASLVHNPFPDAVPSQVLVWFLDQAPSEHALSELTLPGGETVLARGREVFVHYPDGMGVSKLKLPFAKVGTGRNVNTVTKLAAMAKALAGG